MRPAIFALSLLVAFPPLAAADSAPEPEMDSSITVSLIDAIPLFTGTLELTLEQRIDDKFSASVVVGAGMPGSSWGDTLSMGKVAMLGGRGDYFLLGGFQAGISIGTEITGAWVEDGYDNTFMALSLGGYLSAKYVTDSGMTWGTRAGYLSTLSSAPVQVDEIYYRTLWGAGHDSQSSSNPLFTVFLGKSF
jgi:hypothetical protein